MLRSKKKCFDLRFFSCHVLVQMKQMEGNLIKRGVSFVREDCSNDILVSQSLTELLNSKFGGRNTSFLSCKLSQNSQSYAINFLRDHLIDAISLSPFSWFSSLGGMVS